MSAAPVKRPRGRPRAAPAAEALARELVAARPSLSCRGVVLQLAVRGHKVSPMTVSRWLSATAANAPIFGTEKLV